ncbi:MAG: DUF1549 domain-containing protein [Verrucomicrobiae bacterium]|nr:DUF1549 domain-containing protein [Verrucomicrobiae bacterium]
MMKLNSLRSCSRIACVLLLAFACSAPFAGAREWTATDGRKLQATFVKIQGDAIELKLANGQSVTVPKDKLIPADFEAAQRFEVLGDDTLTRLSSKKIDSLLAQTLVKNGYKSFNEPLPDDLFVRRVYLDIIGRIPTREEFQAFAENARPDKRETLIDELLMQPGYASHMFNYFADMFRLNANDDFNNGIRMEPYIQYWKDSLAENKGYAQIVTEMITAQGNVGQNPAAGFILRDAGMEFDAFSNFGQVMLGIDISCAQCHDHPFDQWTMEDFYSMAAFFSNTQRTLGRYTAADAMGMLTAEMPNAPEGWADSFRNLAKSKGVDVENRQRGDGQYLRWYIDFLGWNVTDIENKEMPVPISVADSAEKMRGEIFRPGTILGKPAKASGKTRREALADWLTDPENPRFAMVIANRMWGRAFGRAIVEPVHDFSEDSLKRASQPQALAFITSEMRRVNYDLREFLRIIYNTRAYQSISTYEEPSLADVYYFPGPVLRRMRAEQAWDSLMLLSEGPEIDQRRGRDGSFIREVLNVDLNTASNEEVWAKFEAYKEMRGDRLGAAVVAEPGSLQYSLSTNDGLRASEMVQPAPPSSLLDTFGQSDRRITDEHNFDGSVPQVLALMNGGVTSMLTGSSSKVVNDLSDLDGPDDKVRGVYFTMLSRYPSDEELAQGMKMMEDYGDEGVRDLSWALINSPEFLFIQ